MLYEVIWLHDAINAKTFPYLESFAESDQETEWFWPLSSDKHPEIVLAKIEPEEVSAFEWMKPSQIGLRQFQNRVNNELDRTDLKVTHRFISSSHWATAPHAKSISQFPRDPERGYMSIFQEEVHTTIIRRETLADYVANGGLFRKIG